IGRAPPSSIARAIAAKVSRSRLRRSMRGPFASGCADYASHDRASRLLVPHRPQCRGFAAFRQPQVTYFSKEPCFLEEMTMRRHSIRRGVSIVQYVLVGAAIFLVVVVGMATMGTNTNTKLNQTASDVANPAALT